MATLFGGEVWELSKVPSHWRSIRAISTVKSMEVETYHFTWVFQVMSSKYDVDAYMVTLLGGEIWELC